MASIEDTEMVDSTLANFAEVLGFTKNKGKSIRYKKDNLPIEFGRKGKIFHILGIGPVISDQSSAKQELDQFFQLISSSFFHFEVYVFLHLKVVSPKIQDHLYNYPLHKSNNIS